MAQWLRLHAYIAKGMGSEGMGSILSWGSSTCRAVQPKKKKKKSYGTSLAVPGQGTKMPHATWHGQKKNDRKEYKTLTIADTTVLTISQVLLHTL